MGLSLSQPVMDLETASCGNNKLRVGSSCMQGWRVNMEDAHVHILSLLEDKEASYFAVFDGHGGSKVARYAGMHAHKRIVNHLHYHLGDIPKAIQHGFLDIDREMQVKIKKDESGATAVVVLLKNNKMYCGNAGDSRAIASVAGNVQELSFDHKPTNEAELKRIVAAGGWVADNRVNSCLAPSRALGDFYFKRNLQKSAAEQIITAFPDVTVNDVTEDHEFLVVACDGIWDVLTNQEVVDFVRARIAQQIDPEEICEQLLARCLAPGYNQAGLAGGDNMTAILVCFLDDKPYESLAERCAVPRVVPPPPQNEEGDEEEEEGAEDED